MALEFDGDNRVNVGTLGNFGLTYLDGGVSVSAWFMGTDTADRYSIMGTVNDGSTTGMSLDMNRDKDGNYSADKMRLWLRDEDNCTTDAGSTGTVGVHDGAWHHIAATYDGPNNSLALYVDGQSVGLTYDHQTTPDNFANFQYAMMIGAMNVRGVAGYSIVGTLADVRFYDRVLTASEAAIIYEARGADGFAGRTWDLWARWLMNEQPDGGSATAASTVIDVSGQGYHGTPEKEMIGEWPTYKAAPLRLARPVIL